MIERLYRGRGPRRCLPLRKACHKNVPKRPHPAGAFTVPFGSAQWLCLHSYFEKIYYLPRQARQVGSSTPAKAASEGVWPSLDVPLKFLRIKPKWHIDALNGAAP